jgi:murein DD-endopeptidase MepM/ murein hydrolase activator NlpD
MFKGQLQFGLPTYPNLVTVSFKIVLGVFCFLIFTIFCPNITYAESSLSQANTFKESISNKFQLMFPGYLSQGYSGYHQGLDIATGLGMPIKPIAPGKVISAGYDFFGYGLKVEIDHGNGYKSLYAHLGRIYVKEGQNLPDSSHYIGDVGLTGKTTGPHTHLEVTKDDNYIDARSILPEIRVYSAEEDFKSVGGKGTNTGPQLVEPGHEEKHKIQQNSNNESKIDLLFKIEPLKKSEESTDKPIQREFIKNLVYEH